jgi:hypothetical protein
MMEARPSPAGALDGTAGSGRPGGGPAGSGFILQTGRASLKESLAPLADELARDRKAGRNLIIGAALSGQQDNLGPEDRIVRCRIFSGLSFQISLLGLAQSKDVWAVSRHNIAHTGPRSLPDGGRQVKD